jgi:hypothetical protein
MRTDAIGAGRLIQQPIAAESARRRDPESIRLILRPVHTESAVLVRGRSGRSCAAKLSERRTTDSTDNP